MIVSIEAAFASFGVAALSIVFLYPCHSTQTIEVIHAADRGVRCDGQTDDGPAIQAIAASLTQTTPAVIEMPHGICRIATPVTFTTSVQLDGQGFSEGEPSQSNGTMFQIDKTGFIPFTFFGVKARGSVVRNMGFFQVNHRPLQHGWTPESYDFVFKIYFTRGGIEFDNVLFNGVNKGIYADEVSHMNFKDVTGQFFSKGIEIDNCFDIPRIERFHSWPYYRPYPPDSNPISQYQTQNLDALTLRRVDGIFIDDVFNIAGRSTIHFTSGKQGVTTKAYISNIYSDLTRYGIWVDRDSRGTTFQIANMTAQGNDPNHGAMPLKDATAIQIDAPDVVGQIGNLRADLMYDSAITINAGLVRLDIFSLWATGFNSRNNNSPAIATVSGDRVNLSAVFLKNGGNGRLAGLAGTVYQAQSVDVTK